MFFMRVALLVFLLTVPVLAQAGYSGPMRFSVFWPCMGNASFCAPRILAEGTIERDTHRKFTAFLSNTKIHRHELPPQPDVCFNSPGGNLGGAIELGRTIRRLQLNTCLAPDYSRVIEGTRGDEEVFVRDAVCASACAFALVGGVDRLLESGARYGIHQFSAVKGAIGDSATQITVVALAAYLEEMGISRRLLDVASLVRPSEMHWLSLSELMQLRVDNMTVVPGRWRLNALDNGSVIAEISQTKPGPQSNVSLTILKNAGWPVLVITFIPGELTPLSLREAVEALNGEEIVAKVTLRIDGQPIAAYKSVAWKVATNAAVTTVLPLSFQAVQALHIGKVLDLDVVVPHMFMQYDPSLQFPLDGLGKFLSAVLK
jgi:hypothetical protein